MGEFRTLYIDMNAFFASVEQHENPALRGRPVAITAIDSKSGACVAASYEAKAHGIKVGTPVWEARRLCPDITFLPSRHRLYVRYNLRIAGVLDQMAEVERIRSIDEFQVCLSGAARELDGARKLVMAMKARVSQEIGPAIRFSAGIGPNHLLAKIAGKLEKPDGFAWLSPRNMPDRIAHLKLDDLPGISKGIKHKLYRAAVWDIPALYNLDPRHARMIWRSVEGERFVRALQGEGIPLFGTQRHGYGNSKVLSPEYRTVRGAYLVGRWLLGKAATRMRRDGRVARRLSLMAGGWSEAIKCEATADTVYLLRLHRQLWDRLLSNGTRREFLSVSIHLGDVLYLQDRNGDLLTPLRPAEETRGERVAKLVDQINRRYGAETIRNGFNQPHPGFFERG